MDQIPSLKLPAKAPEMGVSKNNGTPKWMVKIMENPIKMDDLGVPLFLETPKYGCPKEKDRLPTTIFSGAFAISRREGNTWNVN